MGENNVYTVLKNATLRVCKKSTLGYKKESFSLHKFFYLTASNVTFEIKE
jgi:hypothetical protein